jgi:SulP family sulfate permease
LKQTAHRLAIFQLQGFIFFGTANAIGDRVIRRISDAGQDRPSHMIVDFTRVTGLDSTATISFSKIIRDVGWRDVSLAISGPKPTIRQQLLQAGLCEPGQGFRLFSSLDRAVEWCEEQLLANSGTAQIASPPALAEQLTQILGDAHGVAALLGYMERLEVEAGRRIITEGDPADTMYFIERGRVTAQLVRANGQPVRLESMAGGNIVGEVGFYLGGSRTADVVADEDSVIYRLSLPDLERLAADVPQTAATLHRLVAILLAERVAHLTAIVGGS